MAVEKPIEVFFSYSHRDEELRDELEKHLSILKREGMISSWHDRQIPAGSEWAGEIDEHLNTAQIILLLISADFLASDYCYSIEMKRALERHNAGEARVIPIILRPVDWQGSLFGKLQALPKNAEPVTSWANRDEAFTDVARGIRRAVGSLKKQTPPDEQPIEHESLSKGDSQTHPGKEGGRKPIPIWLPPVLVFLFLLLIVVGWASFDALRKQAGSATQTALAISDDDGDNLTYDQEVSLGTDPFNPDTDNDGLYDGLEVNQYGTNPKRTDTDSDTLPDGMEIEKGTSPLNSDTDGDGLLDNIDPDPTHWSTPTNTTSPRLTDTPSPTQFSCPYQGFTDNQTIEKLIKAEAQASNTKSMQIMQDIFSADAIFRDYATIPATIFIGPIERYQNDLFKFTDLRDVEHFDILPAGNGIDGDMATYTSGNRGQFRMVGYEEWKEFYNGSIKSAEFGSDHWVLKKDQHGCWRIYEFDFNAGHVPFP
jgi:hypothetical protein